MKKLLITALLVLIPFIGWSQSQVTRPQTKEPAKKEKSVKQPKTPKNNKKGKDVTPEVAVPEVVSPAPITPSVMVETKPAPLKTEETINGIYVKWNKNTTSDQREAIINLLNSMVPISGGNYKVSKYEIPQGLWLTIMGNNPSIQKGSNLPVENITWYECNDFISKLNSLTNLNFRMLTEEEWDYAIKGNNYDSSGIDAREWTSSHWSYSGPYCVESMKVLKGGGTDVYAADAASRSKGIELRLALN